MLPTREREIALPGLEHRVESTTRTNILIRGRPLASEMLERTVPGKQSARPPSGMPDAQRCHSPQGRKRWSIDGRCCGTRPGKDHWRRTRCRGLAAIRTSCRGPSPRRSRAGLVLSFFPVVNDRPCSGGRRRPVVSTAARLVPSGLKRLAVMDTGLPKAGLGAQKPPTPSAADPVEHVVSEEPSQLTKWRLGRLGAAGG